MHALPRLLRWCGYRFSDHDLPSMTSRMPAMTKGCLSSASTSSVGRSKMLVVRPTATATTGLGSISSRPRPTPRTFWDRNSSSRRARSVAEGRRLRSTGLFVDECMERGERDRARLGPPVLQRLKAAPRRDDWGDADADVVVEEMVESVEGRVVCLLLGLLRLVVSERRRAVSGVGKGPGARLMVVDIDDDTSSIVVSRPSKKWMRSGMAVVKVSLVRSMELVLCKTVCIMKVDCF